MDQTPILFFSQSLQVEARTVGFFTSSLEDVFFLMVFWCFQLPNRGPTSAVSATKDQRISAKIKYEPIPDASFGVTSRHVFDTFFFGVG